MPRHAKEAGALDAGIDARRVMRLGTEYRATEGLPLVLVDADGREIWRLGNCSVCARLPRIFPQGGALPRAPSAGGGGVVPMGRAVHLHLPVRPGDIRGPPFEES